VSKGELAVEVRAPAALAARIGEKLADAARADVGRRVRAGDATLWGPAGTPEIANRLGWLTIAERMEPQLAELEAFAQELRDEGVSDVVLLGMGGSSLAPEVLRRSFPAQPGHPRLHVLDSTDAATVLRTGDAVDLEHTVFIVSSKSGGTIEPLSLFAHFFSLVGRGERFIAITDPGTGLEQLARERGFRRTFHGDPDIGGRYSALSPFGIVPAALIGIDAHALLAGAREAWSTHVGACDGATATGDGDAGELSAHVCMGAALSALAQAGRDKLTFLIGDSLPGLGLWLEQLVAESTGKLGRGILPVADEPLGAPAQYGEDRVFAYLPDVEHPDERLDAAARALREAGHPLITIPTRGPRDLGRVFMLAELTVAVVGWGLSINPFDQPNVQQAKDATRLVLDAFEASGRLEGPPDADVPTVRRLLASASPPAYVAIMGYTEPSDEFDAATAELRAAIRAGETGAAEATTTFGYGPRFLHSTGQFHKGGPKTGLFLQLLHDGPRDVAIPNEPYTFTTLKHAQAIGDLETLRDLGLAAVRVRLHGDDAPAALRELAASVRADVAQAAAGANDKKAHGR
jgi:transaldolase / glucose-6-phosphate isomerase